GAVGYRVYRSPTPNLLSGQEQQLADVAGGTTLSYTDTGGMTTNATPLPQGSTGKWKPLPTMASARESLGVALGTDPADATKHYLYATLGKDKTGALATCEFLPITVGNQGVQTYTTWVAGAKSASAARYQHSIFSADHESASFVPAGTNYI